MSGIKHHDVKEDHVYCWDAVHFVRFLSAYGFRYRLHVFRVGMPFLKWYIPFVGFYTMIFEFGVE